MIHILKSPKRPRRSSQRASVAVLLPDGGGYWIACACGVEETGERGDTLTYVDPDRGTPIHSVGAILVSNALRCSGCAAHVRRRREREHRRSVAEAC